MSSPFPGTVTAVVAQARMRRHLGARVNVLIDGEFSFSISLDLALQYGLKPGFVIDEALLKVLLLQDGDARALARALHYLGYRARSEEEVRKKLLEKEFPAAVIERVLEKLRRNNLLNDAQFAQDWVENRSRFRPRGAALLRQELRHKGVEAEAIDAALPDQDEELENAISALQKIMQSKQRAWKNLEERERQQKAIEYLMRRGFRYAVCKTAWEKYQDEN